MVQVRFLPGVQSKMSDNNIIILTNTPTQKAGEKLAENLVKSKLAACVNVLPKGHSVYRWQNKIIKESENLLIIKAAKSLEKKIYKKIQELHSYEVPEIITINPNNIDAKYAKWINESLNLE